MFFPRTFGFLFICSSLTLSLSLQAEGISMTAKKDERPINVVVTAEVKAAPEQKHSEDVPYCNQGVRMLMAIREHCATSSPVEKPKCLAANDRKVYAKYPDCKKYFDEKMEGVSSVAPGQEAVAPRGAQGPQVPQNVSASPGQQIAAPKNAPAMAAQAPEFNCPVLLEKFLPEKASCDKARSASEKISCNNRLKQKVLSGHPQCAGEFDKFILGENGEFKKLNAPTMPTAALGATGAGPTTAPQDSKNLKPALEKNAINKQQEECNNILDKYLPTTQACEREKENKNKEACLVKIKMDILNKYPHCQSALMERTEK